MLLIRIDKPLSGSLFNNGILIELFLFLCRMASFWHIFYIKLPLNAEFCGSIVLPCMLCFFLCGFSFFAKAETDKDTVKRARMALVCLLIAEFSIQFGNGDVGILILSIIVGTFSSNIHTLMRLYLTSRSIAVS